MIEHPQRLTVLYDETCALCRRARDWLLGEPTYIELELLAAGSPAARERYGPLEWKGKELVAVAEDGRVWIGPSAFLIAMWSTRRWRAWSYRLSSPVFAPLAERFFKLVSAKRKQLGALLSSDPECDWCTADATGAS